MLTVPGSFFNTLFFLRSNQSGIERDPDPETVYILTLLEFETLRTILNKIFRKKKKFQRLSSNNICYRAIILPKTWVLYIRIVKICITPGGIIYRLKHWLL